MVVVGGEVLLIVGGFVLNVDCRFGSYFSCRLLTKERKCRCRFDYFVGVIVDFVRILCRLGKIR